MALFFILFRPSVQARYTCSNLRLDELQTKRFVRSQVAEEALRVSDIMLTEEWVTKSGAADKHKVFSEDW
jgi:hypothetical protein